MSTSINSHVRGATDGLPRHAPIFLLCPARSYSTVTLALLAGHPDIYGFPEMLLFETGTVDGLLNRVSVPPQPKGFAEMRLNGILRAVADVLEASQDSSAICRAKEWLAERSSWSPPELMDYLLSAVYPKIGLEKSPETVSTDEALDACIKHFPQCHFIHLTRHPATSIRSMLNYWSVFDIDEKSRLAFAASAWYRGHSRIMRKLSQLPSERWLRIRAEDVVGDPATWLPYILDWLGLYHDNEIVSKMMQTQNWRFAGTGQSGRLLGGGDAKFLRSPALRPIPRPSEAAFDPSWGLLDEMIDRMTSLASSLGYS
jgi:hypothetical protein